MRKEGDDSAVGKEAPLLQSGYPAGGQAANPSQPVAQSVLQYPDNRVAFPAERIRVNDEPFCSAYLVLFFLGLFITPLFHLCAMCGLRSEHTHEYFAGKISAITCLITLIFIVILGILQAAGAFSLDFEADDDDS